MPGEATHATPGQMTDLLLIAFALAFFAIAALVVRGCQTIVGDDPEETPSR